MKHITILGGGAWGTSIAKLLATNGHKVTLWCFEKEVVDSINNTHVNSRYLAGISLPETIQATHDIGQAVAESSLICEAIPVVFMRKVLANVKPHITSNHRWLVLSKGIEQESLLLPTQIITDILGEQTQVAVLSGPSFARDLAEQKITAVIIASSKKEYNDELQALFKNNFFRPYLSSDVIGVQVGGAFKNVMALGIGFLDGAGYADNSKAFVFTHGLQEMMQCAVVLGGKKESLCGLSGVGDLFLTAMGQSSRNLYLGTRLGQGIDINTIIAELGTTPESANTIISIHQLIQKYKLDLPILEGIYHITRGDQTIVEFFTKLFERPIESDSF